MCGEQADTLARNTEDLGSPPRVRGTVSSRACREISWGITPACAGNSTSMELFVPLPADHPRVCGEQLTVWQKMRDFIGSPPRVRGTATWENGTRIPRRITPACAGNRNPLQRLSGPAGDHPRVCGEQSAAMWTPQKGSGSPPRVRGTAIHCR